MATEAAPTPVRVVSLRDDATANAFPIPADRLIQLCQGVLAANQGTDDPDGLLAPDFRFAGPVVGPLVKEEYVRAVKGFNIKVAFPDLEPNFHHFRVDPFEPNRVWFTTRTRGTHTGTLNFGGRRIAPTGKRVEAAPEACSMTFNADGKVIQYTVGYVMDRRVGNTGGLGALFGLLYAVGHPLPFPEGRPWTPSLMYRAFILFGRIVSRLQRLFQAGFGSAKQA